MSGWAGKHAPFLARLCLVYTFNYLNYVYFAELREFLFFNAPLSFELGLFCAIIAAVYFNSSFPLIQAQINYILNMAIIPRFVKNIIRAQCPQNVVHGP